MSMANAGSATLPPVNTVAALAAQEKAPERQRWGAAAPLVSSLLLAAFIYQVLQRTALSEILRLAQTVRPGPDPWLYPAALISTSIVLLLPCALLSSALALLGRRRASRLAFIILASVVVLLELLDGELLRSIGRHVAEIAVVAFQPEGHVAGGNISGWALMVLKWCVVAALGTTAISMACGRLLDALVRRSTASLRAALGVLGGIGIAMFIAAPIVLLQAWGNHPLVERLYASALVDIRPLQASDDAQNMDPRLSGLYAQIRADYKAAFPALMSGRGADERALALPPRPPNVVLIVTESFRRDHFVPEIMPRMTRWAQQGLIATQHDSGTKYSQSGAFALLYGRNPAVYHQTLDAHVPPQLCATLQRSGYECAYFSGHPKVWLRREEFINDKTMDHFVHDDSGSWPDWDRRALDGMVQLANTNGKPVFAIVLLMSSHFEYRYPPEYEIDRPVSESVWLTTTVGDLGPEAEVPHRNRYRNCMRFIDDAVADAVERLDPKRNIVIFTGDHGESLNDDGRYTHGHSFGDIVTHTPLAMVGPGVPVQRLDRPTSHIDVLPTVFHALTGQQQTIAHVQGVDWLAGEQLRSQLAAHSTGSRDEVEAQLRVSGFRLRLNLDLTKPGVKLLGFEDELAHPTPTPDLSERDVAELTAAFQEQLAVLRR